MVSTSTEEYKSPNFLQRWWEQPRGEKLFELALAVSVLAFFALFIMFFVAWDWAIYAVMPMSILTVFISGSFFGNLGDDDPSTVWLFLATTFIASFALIIMVIFK